MSGNPNSGEDQPDQQGDHQREQNPRGGQGQPRQQPQGQPRQQPQGQPQRQPQGQRRQQPQGQGQRRQQPRGRPGQQTQRRPPAPDQGSSLSGLGSGPVVGIAATMSIAGALMGVLSALLSFVGGFSALPGTVVQIQSALQQQGGLGGGLQQGQSELDVFNQAISTAHETVVTGLATEIAPFVAFALAVAVGVGIAVQSDDGGNVVTAGVGALIGGFLFVALSVFVTSLVYPSVAVGQGGALGAGFADLATETGAILQLQMTNLLLNAVVVGIVTGLTAAASAFTVDRFFPA